MYLIFLSIFRLRDLFQRPFEKAVSFPFSISSIAQFDVASVDGFMIQERGTQPFDTVEGENSTLAWRWNWSRRRRNDERLLSKRVYCCVGDLIRVSLSEANSPSFSFFQTFLRERGINDESCLPVKTSRWACASLNTLTTEYDQLTS